MEDMISRKALCEYALNQKDKSITPNDIMRFPSAQPETHEKRTETHACDCIERHTLDEVYAHAETEAEARFHAQQRWIPCSERLPDEEVLCCDTRGEMIIGYPYQDEESNTGYSAVLDDVVMIDCTAWMPLPEPYRAERGTDDLQ